MDEFGIEEHPDLENLHFSQLGDGPSSIPTMHRYTTNVSTALAHALPAPHDHL